MLAISACNHLLGHCWLALKRLLLKLEISSFFFQGDEITASNLSLSIVIRFYFVNEKFCRSRQGIGAHFYRVNY